MPPTVLFPTPFLCFQSQKVNKSHHSAYLDDSRAVQPAHPSCRTCTKPPPLHWSLLAARDAEHTHARPWKAALNGMEPSFLVGRREGSSDMGMPWVRQASAIFVFPPRDHTASLVNTQRLSTCLIAPAKLPRSNFFLWSSFHRVTSVARLDIGTCFPGENRPFQVFAFKGDDKWGCLHSYQVTFWP